MSFLREKLTAAAVLEARADASNPAASPASSGPAATSDSYKALKGRMHLRLLDKFDLAALETLAPEALRQEISTMVSRMLQEEPEALNDLERHMLIRDIQHEMLGFGPIELLMADPAVSDILVNAYD